MDRAMHTHAHTSTHLRDANSNLYTHTNPYVYWHRVLFLNCGEYLIVCIAACVYVCVCVCFCDAVKSLDRVNTDSPYGLMRGL